MQVAKWFKVLVIGGASMLAVACSEMETEPERAREPSDSGPDSDAGKMHSGITDTGPAIDDGSTQDAGISQDAASAQDAGTSQDAASAQDAAAAPDTGLGLICSMQPNPADACGCPCCWAVGFLNTDPECASFCHLGNNGMGCCE